MNDIVTRLRDWRDVHLARLHLLMEEAADEMERLSANGDCPAPENAANEDNTPAANATPSEGSVQNGCTLTAEEREAVEWAAAMEPEPNGRWTKAQEKTWNKRAATLRGLLERME